MRIGTAAAAAAAAFVAAAAAFVVAAAAGIMPRENEKKLLCFFARSRYKSSRSFVLGTLLLLLGFEIFIGNRSLARLLDGYFLDMQHLRKYTNQKGLYVQYTYFSYYTVRKLQFST